MAFLHNKLHVFPSPNAAELHRIGGQSLSAASCIMACAVIHPSVPAPAGHMHLRPFRRPVVEQMAARCLKEGIFDRNHAWVLFNTMERGLANRALYIHAGRSRYWPYPSLITPWRLLRFGTTLQVSCLTCDNTARDLGTASESKETTADGPGS